MRTFKENLCYVQSVIILKLAGSHHDKRISIVFCLGSDARKNKHT